METIQDLGSYTFPSLLKNSLKKFASRPALALIGQKEVTYAQFAQNSENVGRMLAALGLKPRSKIALYGTGRPEWGEAYFGIVNYGMTAVPLLPDFSPSEIESILVHCGVDAIIVEEKLYSHIENIKNGMPSIVIRLDDFKILKGAQGSIEDFIHKPLPECNVSEEDTASIIYTSGTTGRSKGVELTHKNLVWTAVQGQTIHRVNKMDRCLSFLPLSHVYEFTIGFTMQMMNGSCVYYLGKPPVVSALIPAFAKVQPTIICSVPLVMEKIFKNKVLPQFTSNAFISALYKIRPVQKILHRIAGKKIMKTFGGHVVFFGIGGAKIDFKVEKFLKDAKFPYAIGYGLTETSPLLAGSGPKITIPGTIGIVLEGVTLRVLNPDPKTGVGEIIAKGPNVMKGYYKDETLTKAAFTDESDECGPGWFKTGDLGTLEKKKGLVRLSLKGRSKNMILGPSGENIYPEDIEFILNQHPLVSESLVVEADNGLVAIVQFDEEKLQKEAEARTLKDKIEGFAEAAQRQAEEIARDVAYQKEAILGEIQYFVNTKVNKSSHIEKVQSVTKFEKTASQKIKRYLYDLKSKVSKK